MDKEALLHVLWDARDWLEEYGKAPLLITRIEAQMDLIEDEIWNEKEERKI